MLLDTRVLPFVQSVDDPFVPRVLMSDTVLVHAVGMWVSGAS